MKPKRMSPFNLFFCRIAIAGTMLALLCCPWVCRAEDYLSPDQAFAFSARMANANTIEIQYAIADGYYLYRERFHFKAEGAQLGAAVIPPGTIKFDETLQKNVETFRHVVRIHLPVTASAPFTLQATSQGCADKGLCYAPIDSSIRLSPADRATLSSTSLATPATAATTEATGVAGALHGGQLRVILPLFFLLGLGLSLTPCMLPMMPILASMIAGEATQAQRGRGFLLALAYSLGMALVYTALGIAAGLIGESLAATLQKPWVLSAFALLLVALSLSMFDLYHLQIPASLQLKLTQSAQRQVAGKLFGVFIMGALSALIVGPCVAPPLAGTLIYLSQTRDITTGGSALFSMACGMSVPLLLIGFSAGSLLPRAGLWMKAVNRFFGVLLLAVALWMISPLIPSGLQVALWSALGAGYGADLLRRKSSGWLARAAGCTCVAGGGILLAGLMIGGAAWTPFSPQFGMQSVQFTRIASSAALDEALQHARGKVVLLDFYADWCVACKEMEKLTFPDARVQAQLANMLLLQIDVTANTRDDIAMLKRFHLFGPPAIVFFDREGHEIQDRRVIGYQNPANFLHSLATVLHP